MKRRTSDAGLLRKLDGCENGVTRGVLKDCIVSRMREKQWQPIEAAPEDNPRCLTYTPDASGPDGSIRICPAGLLKNQRTATHWMSLPEPPEAP